MHLHIFDSVAVHFEQDKILYFAHNHLCHLQLKTGLSQNEDKESEEYNLLRHLFPEIIEQNYLRNVYAHIDNKEKDNNVTSLILKLAGLKLHLCYFAYYCVCPSPNIFFFFLLT